MKKITEIKKGDQWVVIPFKDLKTDDLVRFTCPLTGNFLGLNNEIIKKDDGNYVFRITSLPTPEQDPNDPSVEWGVEAEEI